ncbi:MAG: hypothetical protein KJO61_03130 [Deltaproteobacteria bacterium]|nr:hypothetical protein [Deltaproteobacteria bacterium]
MKKNLLLMKLPNCYKRCGNVMDGLIVVDLLKTDRKILLHHLEAWGMNNFLAQYCHDDHSTEGIMKASV